MKPSRTLLVRLESLGVGWWFYRSCGSSSSCYSVLSAFSRTLSTLTSNPKKNKVSFRSKNTKKVRFGLLVNLLPDWRRKWIHDRDWFEDRREETLCEVLLHLVLNEACNYWLLWAFRVLLLLFLFLDCWDSNNSYHMETAIYISFICLTKKKIFYFGFFITVY